MNKICPQHRFVDYEKHSFGYWQKRDCPGDGIYVPGAVEICPSCLVMRLTPDDSRMQTVEVER